MIAAAHDAEINIRPLAYNLAPIKYARGTAIFRKGERGDCAYVVGAGEVEFPELGAQCGSGGLFGEIAVFSPDHVRTASAVCASDVELYRIDEQAILMASYQDPALASALLRLITRRLLHNCAHLEAELTGLKSALPSRADSILSRRHGPAASATPA